jgi:CubicO group peptidase (beta-lactamase class C family)
VTTLAGMGTDLPRSLPADEHVDPAAVLAAVDAIDADPAVELHSLMVVRHGRVVAEGWWAPHTPERTRLLYSLSKSFTTTALAFALEEGLLGLEDPVVSHFPEFADDITDPGSRSITVRHVASMASGHDREMIDEALALDPEEPVRGFLMAPPDAPPGTLFAYSQPCTYALASIIQRAAEMPLSAYLRPRLLDPLGIGEVGWATLPPGREQGFSGLFARTEDVAKLGLLYLQRGRWGETQLIPEAYVAQATSRQIDNPDMDNVDWRQGYGFQFWMARHGYRGDGAFGQFCIVLPEQDVVIATTGGTEAMQAVLDHLWTHLLPGLRDDRPDDSAQPELERRLRGLALAPYAGRSGPPRWEDWTSEFVATPGSAFTSVELRSADGGLEVTLAEADNAVTFPVGTGRWQESSPQDAYGDVIPVAASGGWADDHTLRVGVVFLETPHRLRITCSLPAHTSEVTWLTEPLDGGELATLHRPRAAVADA